MKRGVSTVWVVVIVVIVMIAALFAGGSVLIKASLDDARSKGKDLVMKSNLEVVRLEAEIFYDDAGRYPAMLSEIKNLPEGFDSGQVYYAVSRDGKKFHAGVTLMPGGAGLESDVDFDSVEYGYVGGFAGVDPIYDIVNLESYEAQAAGI